MSGKSITPIPTQDTAGIQTPASSHLASMPIPNLSELRKKWNRQADIIPSIPEDIDTAQPAARMKKEQALPEIPSMESMGAMASKAALAMEGFSELFGEDEEPWPMTSEPTHTPVPAPLPSPLPVSDALSSEPSIFDLGTDLSSAQKPAKRSALNIPQMTLPNMDMAQYTGPKTEPLTAMPIAPEPNVSIPLVRDQFTKPPKAETATAQKPEPESGLVEGTPAVTSPKSHIELASHSKSKVATAPPPQEKKADEPSEHTSPKQSPQTTATPKPIEPAATREYTDKDLQEALQPIIAPTVDKFLYTPTHGIHTYLEPMLRSTVRRAIAEQMEEASPFHDVSGWDKFAWKLQALMSSRTYENIVFDRTRRYQVEEVFLLRPQTRSLISYASNDPSRHSKPSKVQSTVKKIAAKTAEKAEKQESSIEWENERHLMIRRGKHGILAAIVHGSSNAILRSDLDYALRQAEERFGKSLEEESDIHLQILQPLLEGCLLIQSPAIPN